MNHQHTKTCNSLDPERVNKLVYIVMNTQALKKGNTGNIMSDEELEERLLEAEDEDYLCSCYLQNLLEGKPAEDAVTEQHQPI